MKIHTIDLEKLVDFIVDIIEAHVFDNEMQQPSFRVEEKNSIKRAANIFLKKTFDEFDIVELKNKHKEEIEEQKKIDDFKKSNIIH